MPALHALADPALNFKIGDPVRLKLNVRKGPVLRSEDGGVVALALIHNIAHRGASAYEPENTLRAFERAIEMGATMMELDVHLSRDGQPVVIHDPDLSRTTDGTGRVGDLTLEQIQRLDAGLGEHIPTLAEVIDLVRGRRSCTSS